MFRAGGNESVHKLIIFGGSGLLVLAELFSVLSPRASHSVPNKKFVLEEQQNLPPEDREATNPTPNWFERHFCRGLSTAINCDYGSSVHPSIRK